MLIKFFTEKFSIKFDKKIYELPDKFVANLLDYSWPGNIRELRNIIERAVILSKDGKLHIDDGLRFTTNIPPLTRGQSSSKLLTKDKILETLHGCGWKIEGANGTAARLNVAASTLRDRMRKLGINRNI